MVKYLQHHVSKSEVCKYLSRGGARVLKCFKKRKLAEKKKPSPGKIDQNSVEDF